MTKLDTPKSDYRERTGTEWLGLGLGSGLVFVRVKIRFSVNPNHYLNLNLALKLTTRFQSFLGNLILEYPV